MGLIEILRPQGWSLEASSGACTYTESGHALLNKIESGELSTVVSCQLSRNSWTASQTADKLTCGLHGLICTSTMLESS